MTRTLRAPVERFRALLRLHDPPWRIALALAVGVFISCTLLYGFQTLLSLLVATIFRLNKAATVTGAWLNLPWFAPLVYGGALRVGLLIVPDPDGMRSAWLAYFLEHPASLSWRDVLALLHEVSVVLLVGTTLVGLAAAAVTYVVALVAISARRGRGPGV